MCSFKYVLTHLWEYTNQTIPRSPNGIGCLFSYLPYITVSVIVKSHLFSPNLYSNRFYKDREPIHNRINELRSDGLGYKRIHKVLVSEKFKIGKSPTTVDSMIRKMDRRDRILNQKTEIEIVKVDIGLLRN